MAGGGTRRQHDLDNLRTFLTSLVILHHTAIAYGGAGSWLFKSAIFTEPSLSLLLFNAVDQSFFMGLFFWISGRMSALALRKTSPVEFWRGRLIRLGVPTLFYTLIIHPATLALASPEWKISAITQCFYNYWKSMQDVHGPVWYTATLLLFDTVSAACHRYRSQPSTERGQHAVNLGSKYRVLGMWGLLGVSITSWVIRLWYPIGALLKVISVQPAYLLQYMFAYKMGQLSLSMGISEMECDETDRHESVDARQYMPQRRLKIAVLVSTLAFHIIFIPPLIYGGSDWIIESISQLSGGVNATSLLYSVWNESSFYVIGSSMVFYFRQDCNYRATSWLWQSRYSYAAFLFHAPVSVTVEIFAEMMLSWAKMKGILMESVVRSSVTPVLITMILGGINVLTSFLLGGWLVEALPIIQNVI